MIIVVDANILFSALITPNGRLAKILSHPTLPANLVSCHFLITELLKHQAKIIRCAKRPESIVLEDMHCFLKNITLYEETIVQKKYWLEAEHLTDGVDNFDVSYVALALQTGGLLWTGDKKLATHLNKLGFKAVINTIELYEIIDIS